MVDALDIVRAENLAGFSHGFFGRSGGHSSGDIAGLNVGFGAEDDPEIVARNRRLAAGALSSGSPLVTPHQVHSAEAVIVDEPWSDDNRPVADALVTRRPDIVIGIVTADCAPVLLADAEAGVIAAAHAGWRGAHGGIIEATVAAMEQCGARPSRVCAAIGPCIAQESYEVREDFAENFTAADGAFFGEGQSGHYQFDLLAYVGSRLTASGVAQIEPLGLDTYANSSRFFSFRRATHRGEPTYGRQLSAIALSR